MASPFVQKAEKIEPRVVELTLAHSPDSDDAFMFYALATKKLGARDVSFTHRLEDIETLNRKALEGVYDITAISFHAYPYLEDKYVLLPSGASFGDRYGPVVVSQARWNSSSLKGKRVAVPGKMTTAYLALQLYEPEVDAVVTPFDQILDTGGSRRRGRRGGHPRRSTDLLRHRPQKGPGPRRVVVPANRACLCRWEEMSSAGASTTIRSARWRAC